MQLASFSFYFVVDSKLSTVLQLIPFPVAPQAYSFFILSNNNYNSSIKSVVAVDRYNVIVKGMSGSPLTFKKVTSWIAVGWIWSLFWAIMPLMPAPVTWGQVYAIDGMLGS